MTVSSDIYYGEPSASKQSGVKRRIVPMIVTVILTLTILTGLYPAAAETSARTVYVAGNFWSDVDAVVNGRALRLWMVFSRHNADPTNIEGSLPGETTIDEIREGYTGLYANQFTQLSPSVSVDASELELYLVDSQFQLALPLTDFTGTLEDLWVLATGDMVVGDAKRAPVDRSFTDRANPLGVTLQAMTDYVRRIAAVTNSNVSNNDIEAAARDMLTAQMAGDEPRTGFILMFAPKDQTTVPYELEIRSPVVTDEASIKQFKKKPAGHMQASIEGITPASTMITQARIKSGVFLDLRVYNGNTQLSFKQSSGRCDAGPCLDLTMYGKLANMNLSVGMSRAAKDELTRLKVKEIHLRVCTPGGVKPYVEYWLSVPVD